MEIEDFDERTKKEGKLIGCDIEFSQEFMAQDADLRQAMVFAMQETVNDFVENTQELPDEDEIIQATEDAHNFLTKCVQNRKGKFK